MKKRQILAAVYIFIIPGLALFLGAFFLFQQKMNFIESASVVSGTVIKSIPLASGTKSGSLYYPYVSFVTKSGKQIEFTSDVGTSLPNYIEGSSVKVFYDPTNPNKAEIDGMYVYIFDPKILSFLGTIFVLMGLWTILNEYQKKERYKVQV